MTQFQYCANFTQNILGRIRWLWKDRKSISTKSICCSSLRAWKLIKGKIHEIILQKKKKSLSLINSTYFYFQSRVVAILVPEIEAIKEYAATRKIPNKSFSFLCNQTQIKNLLQTELDKISRLENLKDFETVCHFYSPIWFCIDFYKLWI